MSWQSKFIEMITRSVQLGDPRHSDEPQQITKEALQLLDTEGGNAEPSVIFYAILLSDPYSRYLPVLMSGNWLLDGKLNRFETLGSLAVNPMVQDSGFSEPLTSLTFCATAPRDLLIQLTPDGPPRYDQQTATLSIPTGDWAIKVDDFAVKSLSYENFDAIKFFNKAINFARTWMENASPALADLIEHFRVLDQSREELLRVLRWSLLWNRSMSPDWTHLYFIPSASASEAASSGMVIARKGGFVSEQLQLLKAAVTLLSSPCERSIYARGWLSNTKRTARTAIFSRNFSHVTGSHVISNPEFAKQLVYGTNGKLVDMAIELKRTLEEARSRFEDYVVHGIGDRWRPWNEARNDLETQIRNLSGGPELKAVNRFHNYLQARFDFIARAVEETGDQPDPVFLISELLDGFLEQEEFLDTLVADLGVRLKDMEFEVEFRLGNTTATFSRSNGQWNSQSGSSGQIGDFDFLVGLPGGGIAAQAFYSLLENVIRNSIKYQPGVGKYILTITIKDAEKRRDDKSKTVGGVGEDDFEGRFLIEIKDNRSKNKSGAKKVSSILGTPLVSDKGAAAKTGLGIQEMKLCAEYLVSGDFKTTLSKTNVTDEGEVELEKRNGKADFDPHQDLFLGVGKPEDALTFMVEIEQPMILGLVTTGEESSSKGIVCVRNEIGDFEGQNAHILIVDYKKQAELAAYLNDTEKDGKNVHRNHRLLPCRLLVLARSKIKVDAALEPWKNSRRVHFLNCETAYRRLFGKDDADDNDEGNTASTTANSPTSCCTIKWAEWWNQLPEDERPPEEQLKVMIAYAAWLRAYKGHEFTKDDSCEPAPWLLCLGFERDHAQVQAAWAGVVDKFNKYSDLIKLIVRSKSGDSDAEPVSGSFSEPNLNFDQSSGITAALRSRMLVFDNHGRCFGETSRSAGGEEYDYRNSLRYFQQFGGKTPDLYRILSRPPRNLFGFAFFIHSLVESCLTNVVIVDERFAGDLLFESGNGTNESFNTRLSALQKSGLFPVFTMKPNSEEKRGTRNGHYTPKHQSVFEEKVKGNWAAGQDGKSDESQKEGIAYDLLSNQNGGSVDCGCSASLQMLKLTEKAQFKLTDELKPDVFVIHEGALDILKGEGGIEWEPDQDRCLYKIAPIVVRTSGRGRRTENLNPTVPFIEFHIVSSAVLTSRNKYGLVRGLYGATGHDIRD
jgi:hypothetical protein